MNVNSHQQPSSVVEALLLETLAEQKAKSEAETAEAIAKVKAEAEEKVRAYTDTIAKVKAEAEQEARAYTDTIAKVKAEAEEKARPYTDTIAELKPSTRVGALLLGIVAEQKAKSEAEAAEVIAQVKAEVEEAIAKVEAQVEAITLVKAEAAEAITSIKAEAEEKARAYTDTIAKVKAEAEHAIAEQKTKSEAEVAEVIAKVKAEAEEKARTYTDTIARVKAEAEEAIAKVKAEAEEKTRMYADTITKVKAEEKAAIMDESKEHPISETTQRKAASPASDRMTTMGGMFYSLQKAAARLNKTEEQLKEIVKQAKLSVFRNGSNILLKADEIEALASKEDITIAPDARPAKKPTPQTPEIGILELEGKEPETQETVTSQEQPIDLETLDLDSPARQTPDLEIPAPPAAEPHIVAPPAKALIPQDTFDARPWSTPTVHFRTAPWIEETDYPQKLSLRQWFIKGLRADKAAAVIVLCLLLSFVLSIFAVSGYFVYTILKPFL